jgi:serine/threonine protein kinase
MEAYASMMSDVFSFGIIIIEIITGRRASPFVDLPEWVSDISKSFCRTSQLAQIIS